MIREEFAQFLKKLKTANDNGQDIDAIVKENEHRNVYFYNDGCIKKILASEKNLTLTTDLINAALNLVGSDRIENPQLVNPYVPGELGYRSVEPDLLLTNDRGTGVPRDRISIDVQHENNDSLYSDRLVLYVARLTGSMEKQGDFTPLENLHVVSFQFFDAFKGSPNYLHTVQLRNQEQRVYFERQTVTLVEVNKFLKHAEQFAGDRSRIAQWLRAIDTLNREADFSEFAGDPVFRVLQNEVKLCNFSAGYMLSNIMKDIDKSYWEYGAARKKAKEVAKNLLLDGDSVEKSVPQYGASPVNRPRTQEGNRIAGHIVQAKTFLSSPFIEWAFFSFPPIQCHPGPSRCHPRPFGLAQGRLRRGPCTSFQRMFAYANMTKAFFVIPDLVGRFLTLPSPTSFNSHFLRIGPIKRRVLPLLYAPEI